MSIVESIMPLEIEKTSRTSHGTDRRNKRISFARVINDACCISMNPNIDPQPVDDITWFLWVRKRLIFSCSIHEFILSRRAGIFTPKSFQIYGANIASSSLNSEYSIDLLEVFQGYLVVVSIAAAQPMRLNIVFAGSEGAQLKRFRIDMKRHVILIDTIPTFALGQADHENEMYQYQN